MKDLSFLLLKNNLGAKMRKGFKNFCNGDGSTSTLNQRRNDQDMSCMVTPSLDSSSYLGDNNVANRTPTLEEMILQLELEEEAARKAKLNEYEEIRRRMSCVTNSDVLRSARNALNQYPRFSLDGKDAMYRSSFRNITPVMGGGYKDGRKSVCCGSGLTERILLGGGYGLGIEKNLNLPHTIGGKSVIWCKPSVVATLMGLEAMPIPITRKLGKGRLSCKVKSQNLRRAERHEMEKQRGFTRGMNGWKEIGTEARRSFSTTNSSCVTKAIPPVELPRPGEGTLAELKDFIIHWVVWLGWSAKCVANNPTVRQTQVGFEKPPKFLVEVQNNCPMCPVIDVHLKCGTFPQNLVNPRLFKVLGQNDCVVNGGLPLGPLQKVSFSYSHQKFLMSPSTWFFQCE